MYFCNVIRIRTRITITDDKRGGGEIAQIMKPIINHGNKAKK